MAWYWIVLICYLGINAILTTIACVYVGGFEAWPVIKGIFTAIPTLIIDYIKSNWKIRSHF